MLWIIVHITCCMWRFRKSYANKQASVKLHMAYWQDLQEQALQMQPVGGIFALTKWAFLQQNVCVYIYIYVLHHSAIAICSLKKTHVNLGAQFRAFFAFAESTLLPFGQHFYDGSEWTLPSALQHGASCTWNCRLLDSIGSKRKNIERYCPPHPRDMLTQEKAKTSITLVRFSFRWQIQAQSA